VATGQVSQVTQAPIGSNYDYPTWSPDGKNLAYPALVNGGTLRQLFVNGEAVSVNEDVFAFAAPWLSNDTLVYAADGKLWRRNVTTGKVAPIPFAAQVSVSLAAYPLKAHNFDSTASQAVTGIVTPALSRTARTSRSSR
jgi:hypothetical protein